jgi:hypothetical protein
MTKYVGVVVAVLALAFAPIIAHAGSFSATGAGAHAGGEQGQVLHGGGVQVQGQYGTAHAGAGSYARSGEGGVSSGGGAHATDLQIEGQGASKGSNGHQWQEQNSGAGAHTYSQTGNVEVMY